VGLVTFFVFMAALLPRLYALGDFLTIDEVKWAEGTAQFLLALYSGNLAQTYWHFFPGVTIAWGGALTLAAMCLPAPDLAGCANTRVTDLANSIGWLRLWPVLLTTIGVTGVYLLGRKLLDEKVALLAALLLAFDPFFLAHSRILNGDAVTAILMVLSLLAFLSYGWGKAANENTAHPSREAFTPSAHPFLFLSGVMAGLALLTKLPAPLIGLFIGGLGLLAMALSWRREGWLAARRWLVALGVWGGIALLVFIALWPALWVAPVDTLQQMYADAFAVGGAGAGHDTFYLGQTFNDPGPWFYPYVIAFRLTPVVAVGLLFWVVWLFLAITDDVFRPSSQRLARNQENTVAWINLIFIVFIIVFANASPKKLDRYVMAVIPTLIFLSAWGWVKAASFLLSYIPTPPRTRHYAPPIFLLLAGLVALQLLSTLFAAPYYLTYYNPLLGGVQRAVTQAPVGWGEGLEQAAQYLNQLPQAEALSVSSWYSDIFSPYFVGQRASFADDGRAQLAADYVVFYVNQIQRQKPYPGLVNYFRAGEPVFVVRVGPLGNLSDGEGVPWVEVYQAPAAQSASGAPKIEGVAQLLAYKVVGDKVAGSRVASSNIANDGSNLDADDKAQVTLFLRVLGPLPGERGFKVSLVPNPTSVEGTTPGAHGANETQNPEWGVWHPAPMKGEWVEGAVIEWPGTLALPAEMPAGDYRLSVSLQASDGSTLAEFAISAEDPSVVVK
jgi:4-amino-4-deoxy-L-arabinose transferase-like glycosyltransferase